MVGGISETTNNTPTKKSSSARHTRAIQKEERKRQVIVMRPGAVNTGFWQKVPFRMAGSALVSGGGG